MKRDINEAKYLDLDKLTEERELQLHVHINEARVESGNKVHVLGRISGNPIVTDDSCEHYEFVFERYVCYSVKNESFGKLETDAVFEGKLFRVYTKSKFLDYVRSSCILLEELAPGLKHYQFICINHIIDVATAKPPSSS